MGGTGRHGEVRVVEPVDTIAPTNKRRFQFGLLLDGDSFRSTTRVRHWLDTLFPQPR